MRQRIDPTAKTGAQIQSMFEAIAPRYDLLNRVLSAGCDRRWRRAAVRAALDGREPGESLSVLDVCCGTGDLAGEFRRDPRVRRVLGVDFVQAMVSRARNKFGSTAAGLEFAVGDAQQLPVGGGGFDVISIAFGLRNLTRPEGGLEGMAQLLRPGGRLVVLEFFRPRRGWWASAFRWYFRRVLPVIGRALSGTRVDAYRYLPESVEHFADPETVCDWTKRAGLINARIRPLTLGAVSLIVAERPSTEDPPDLRERWEETAVRDEDSKARSHRVSQDTSQWEYVPCST